MNIQKKNFDSAFCGSLPLHHLNVIQPHGVLLVLGKDGRFILQASENVLQLLGISAPDIVNTPFADYANAEGLALLSKRFQRDVGGKVPVHIQLRCRSRRVDTICLTHAQAEYLILEFFATSEAEGSNFSFINMFRQVKYITAALETAATKAELCAVAARELKEFSGFDKVLIYRFDEDWNGAVVAEVKEEGMESYMGLKFPASDIPKQARQMYIRNAYRLIPNRQYEPVRIYPVLNPLTNAFLDMSDCEIRGVAAVHLEYMKNMEINASMSTRILLNGDHLWGLISCHHREAKWMDFESCSVFEMVSASISARMELLLQKQEFSLSAGLQEMLTKLINQVYTENNLIKGLLHRETSLLQLMNSGGVVISYNKTIETAGQVPNRNSIRDLILWLQTRNISGIYTEDSLSSAFENAISYANVASGIMAIPINPAKGDFILFFRPEVVQEVEWGGNPSEAIRFEMNSVNYHPRNSFQVWQQVVKYTSLPWQRSECEVAEQFRYFILEHIVKSSISSRQL